MAFLKESSEISYMQREYLVESGKQKKKGETLTGCLTFLTLLLYRVRSGLIVNCLCGFQRHAAADESIDIYVVVFDL